MYDTYQVIKDINPEIKIMRHLYAADLFFILGAAIIGFMFQSLVAESLRTFFIIFCVCVALGLRIRSPFNANKKMFHSFLYLFKKNRCVYKPICSEQIKKPVVYNSATYIDTSKFE